MEQSKERSQIGVKIIGIFKLMKAVSLFITAALLPILGKHQSEFLFGIVRMLNVDPQAKFFQGFVRKFLELSPKFPLLSAGMFFYAAIFLVEGMGLLLKKSWAEYLTLFVTISFLPIEFYELAQHASVLKMGLIALNILIVIYLAVRLHAKKKERKSDAPALRSSLA